MKQFNYRITDAAGLHARPAGMLVKEVTKYNASVVISCNGKEVEGKRLMALMGLGAKKGDELVVTVTGDEEEAAAAGLAAFCKTNL